jgi:hypothetical protein
MKKKHFPRIYENFLFFNLKKLKFAPKTNSKLDEDGPNIYQSIDDIENSKSSSKNQPESQSLNDTSSLNDDPTKAILGKSSIEDDVIESNNIYSTPSNKRVVKSSADEKQDAEEVDESSKQDEYSLNQTNQNSSVVHLLNDNDETNA